MDGVFGFCTQIYTSLPQLSAGAGREEEAMSEPVKCVCGRKPELICSQWEGYSYSCPGTRCGWWGPERKTERGAISAWNRVMGKGRGKK